MPVRYFLIVVDPKTLKEERIECPDRQSVVIEAREWKEQGYTVRFDVQVVE